MKTCLVFLLVIFLVSCSPSESAIQTPLAATLAAIPTQTAYPTYTPLPVLPAIIVTATLLPLTPTPEFTDTPQPTINPNLETDKTEGVWLVGTEVAVGNWRAVGDDCYEVIYDKFNEQLEMASGIGSVIYVPTNAYTVKFVSYPGFCTWTYLGK